MALDQIHEQERFEKERGDMTFFEHITELRGHLLRSALAIFIFGIVFFLNKNFVFNVMLFGPRYDWFPTYKAICGASHLVGLGDKMCIKPTVFEISTRQFGEVLMQHLYVSFWLGVICAFPYIFWEFWRFIRPGLYEKEQKAVRGIVAICSALFITGVMFGYFIIAPFSINFLGGYTLEGIKVSPTLDSYVTYMTMFTLPTGLIFELPILAYFLSKIGLIGPAFLRSFRRYAIVILLIIAAIITPPDVVSQTLVFIPLYGLYEVSIMVSARVQKKRALELAKNEKAVQPVN